MPTSARSVLAVLGYAAVVAAAYLAAEGPHASVAFAAVLLAHAAVGALIRRRWVYGLPAGLGVLVILDAYGEDAFGLLAGALVALYGLATMALGRLVGSATERRARPS